MWPKMLIELLPHLTRLVPMWERFLNSRQANEKVVENAVQAMADQVHSDLGQVTAAQAGLYRQLQEQSTAFAAQIAVLADEVHVARLAAQRAEDAVRRVDTANAGLAGWIKGGVVAIVLLLLVVIVLLLTHRGA